MEGYSRNVPRRRLFSSPNHHAGPLYNGGDDDPLSPGNMSSLEHSVGSRTPKSAQMCLPNGDALLESPSAHPISAAFKNLQNLTYGRDTAPISNTEVLYKPDTQFDKIVQKSKEYLPEVDCVIARIKNDKDLEDADIADLSDQIGRTLGEIEFITNSLHAYLKEANARQTFDGCVSPRVSTDLKNSQAALIDVDLLIKKCRKELQLALAFRERRDLLNEWSPFDKQSRVRDAEELMSDSTERLMNSKRIMVETIESSSGTLGSLAASSQSIQKNDEELSAQGDMVSSASSLLKKYGRRASTDRLSIWIGFVFFVFCALIVVYRRMF